MTQMLSHADCLAKALELERRAEGEPKSDRNYLYMAAAWRRLATQSEWQDRLLAIIDRGLEVLTGPGLITFHHIKTPGRFVFSSPELPGWTCAGRSRELAGRKVIGSWRKYLANHHDLGAGVRAELTAMVPYRQDPTTASRRHKATTIEKTWPNTLPVPTPFWLAVRQPSVSGKV